MGLLRTTTGKLLLFVAILALLRFAVLPIGGASSPWDPVFSGLMTVPASGSYIQPVPVRFLAETVPTIHVMMMSPVGAPSPIRLRVFETMDPQASAKGQGSAVFDTKTITARRVAIRLSPPRAGEKTYYVMFSTPKGAPEKTFFATIWLDQVPKAMILYEEAQWLFRFVLVVLVVLLLIALRPRRERPQGVFYSVPPAQPR